jgi:hypothetical protein
VTSFEGSGPKSPELSWKVSEMQACSVRAGDGNRNRMTSLEGVPHRAVTLPDLRIAVTGGAPY